MPHPPAGEAFATSAVRPSISPTEVQNVSSPHLPRRRQSVIPVPVFASSPTRTATIISSSESSASEDSVQVLIGPTHLATTPVPLSTVCLPSTSLGARPIQSSEDHLVLTDLLRLAEARQGQAPLSFGSAMHVVHGRSQSCRPCMFERRPGRCTKGWLCDFCHLHAKPVRRNRGSAGSATSASTQTIGSGGRQAVVRPGGTGEHLPPPGLDPVQPSTSQGSGQVSFVRLSL
mmetsp:Transcript_45819/g.106463  ORF Transcript_45819/g.106463 Transcript_45819/m.106463 type:complete len:231 (-) Transcript_45819:244-936(-)